VLVIFRGLPGTGKSYVVRHLVERRPGLHVLSRDVLRRALLPHPTWSDDEKAFVDELVAEMAGWLVGRGRDVVIDGAALSSAAGVDRLVSAAEAHGAAARIIECVCRQETALQRIKGDEGRHLAGDRGEALYFKVKSRFERVRHPLLVVDTDRGIEENLGQVLAYLTDGRMG
jgi:predicted kinase